MGTLSRILGNSSDDKSEKRQNKYREVERLDSDVSTTETNEQVNYIIQTVEIRQNTDVLQAKDELRDGHIVIADFSDLSAGMDEDRVKDELSTAVNDVGGDIVLQNTDEHLILAPNGVKISRRAL